MKLILRRSGYEHEISLETLNDSKIEKIESFMNENKHLLKKTVYDSTQVFKFMPGHRAVIEEIPKKIVELNKYRQRKAESEAENAVLVSEEQKIKLKQSLIDKLIKYAKGLNCVISLQFTDIVEFEYSEKNQSIEFKCRVKCPFCDKKYLCVYRTYWSVSNIESHFKNHIIAIQGLVQGRTTATSGKVSVHRMQSENDPELNEILTDTSDQIQTQISATPFTQKEPANVPPNEPIKELAKKQTLEPTQPST